MVVKKFTIQTLLALCGVLSSYTAWAVDVEVYGLFKNMAILKIDGKQRKLKVGQTSPEGVKLISADSFSAELEVEGKRDVYKLGAHVSTSFIEPKLGEAKIMPIGEMYMTTGFINKQQVNFLVDTGASTIAMNVHHARSLGINFRYVGSKIMVSTANGVTQAYKITLNSVRVGDIELKNIEAAVVDGDSPRIILLGNSFLNQVEMQRQGQIMLLKQKY